MKHLLLTLASSLIFLVSSGNLSADENPVPTENAAPTENTVPESETPKQAEPTPSPAETPKSEEKPSAPIQIEGNFVETEKEAEELGPKNKEFMKFYFEFREIVKRLNALKAELPDAKPERQVEIDKEYTEKVAKGIELNKKMVDTGLDAFDEAPNRNPFACNYLYSLVEWEFQRDNFDQSVRIFKRLAVHGIDKTASILYVFAAWSALMTMDLDNAEKWLQIADELGVLQNVVEGYSQNEKGRETIFFMQGMFSNIEDFRKNWAKEQEIRKAETEAGEKDPAQKLPRVLLKTTKGDIVVELFENEAPNTVANFVSLVESGFYDGTIFHRVLPRFMAQGGDPRGNGSGGPGYSIDCENRGPNARKHFRGSLSMAHAGADTGGSQFFLTFIPTYSLDRTSRPPGHTVFGRVVEGIDVLADIQRYDPDDKEAIIPERDKIVEAKVLYKRDHEYKPIKNANRR